MTVNTNNSCLNLKFFTILKLLLLVMLAPSVYALSFEEYKRAQQQEFNEWKSAQDKAFYQFLKEGWKKTKIAPPIEVKRPKPEVLPVVQPEEELDKPKIVEPVNVVVPSIPEEKVLQPEPVFTGFKMSFYGQSLVWSIDRDWQTVRNFNPHKIDKEQVAEFWKTFAKLNLDTVLDEFDDYSHKLNLNGWGRLQLADQFAKKLMYHKNSQKLLAWALLVKMNEAVRLGYNDQGFYLLYHSQQPLFNVNYWTYDDKRYYIFEADGGRLTVSSLYTYEGDFSERTKALDLNYHQNPIFFTDARLQTISFNHQGKSYQFKAPVSQNYADYLYSLPLQKSDTYFSREPSEALKKVLIPQVKSVVAGMSQEEAINFLLAFAQKGLKYKLDKEHFNRSEKYLLPEETLLYVYSDCEDHSFLFAWLVRNVLGLSVVGLEYSGHIATAVNVQNPKGKTYLYQNRHYAVADPTYINASYGMEMPQYSGKKVKLIPVN